MQRRCEFCGFEFQPRRKGKNRFCSQKCHYESKGCCVECKNCNSQFRVQPHQVDKVKFCSSECREAHCRPFDCGGILCKYCTGCGQLKAVSEFYKNSKVKSGLNSSCKACENERRREFYQTDRGKQKARRHNRTITRRFHSAKCNAKRRDLKWEIAKDDYITLVEGASCHYCCRKLDDAGGGLDRKDNGPVYCLAEVVPCCGRCNKTFMDNYNYHEKLQLAEVIKKIDEDRCSCPLLDGIQVTGSSCSVHGLPSCEW